MIVDSRGQKSTHWKEQQNYRFYIFIKVIKLFKISPKYFLELTLRVCIHNSQHFIWILKFFLNLLHFRDPASIQSSIEILGMCFHLLACSIERKTLLDLCTKNWRFCHQVRGKRLVAWMRIWPTRLI